MIDVDAALPGVTVKWRDREWHATPGVPLAALSMASGVEDFSPSNVEHAALMVAGLFDVDPGEISALNPTREELWFILRAVAKEVGSSLGEWSASSGLSGV